MDRHDPHIEAFPLLHLAVVLIQPGLQHLAGSQVVVFRLGLDAVVEEGKLTDHKYIFYIVRFFSNLTYFPAKDLFIIFHHLKHGYPIFKLPVLWIFVRNVKLQRPRII